MPAVIAPIAVPMMMMAVTNRNDYLRIGRSSQRHKKHQREE